jgi:hypothetical protein
MNRIIWLFRETRSGSTWLAGHLCEKLNKKSVFLEAELPITCSLAEKIKKLKIRQPVKSDYESIIHTHVYELTSILDKYDNPFVLRCSRKNKFEQFLSWCAIKYSDYKFYNLEKNKDQTILFEEFISKKIIITKKDYNIWRSYEFNRINKFWKLTDPYETQVIYYEDLLEGTANIPNLNLYNIKMNDDDFIRKLPNSYKKDMILNYNEVKTWFKNDQY